MNEINLRSNLSTERGRRLLATAASTVIVLFGSMFVASPASAQEAKPDVASVEAALANAGVLTPSAGARSLFEDGEALKPAELSAKGLTIQGQGGAAAVTMTPVSDGDVSWTTSGTPVFSNTSDSVFVLTSANHGSNAGYSVVFGPDAPSEYSYEFTVDGKPAKLRATKGGGIEVLSRSGTVANLLAPAWAVDAHGADVATVYVINENIVTQVVHHGSENAYPVVADPRLRCDSLWCTVEATRAETAQIADNALNGSILCLFIPAQGAPACGTVVLGAWAMANIARSQGKCIGYRVWAKNFISWPHLAYISCYR